MKIKLFFSARVWCWLLTFCLGACIKERETEVLARQVEGYRPIYMSYEEMQNVFVTTPHPLQNAGKIYVKGNLIFVNEINKGIHIIDNHNPSAPQNLAFIHIPGNVDLAVKNNTLYADNATDLLTIDISSPEKAKVIKRTSGAFPSTMYPPLRGVSFECVDQNKGVVAGWEKAMLDNPRCYR